MKTAQLGSNTILQLARALAEEINNGINSWIKAGEIVVRLVDEHGATLDQIAEYIPAVSVEILQRFEQIGRKQVVPNLLVAGYPAARHLISAPYSDQTHAIEKGVEVVIHVDGKYDVLNVKVENLSAAQCRQVFTGSGVRTPAAQRAYIESIGLGMKAAKPGKPESTPYTIVSGGRIAFREGCVLTRSELAKLLAQIS